MQRDFLISHGTMNRIEVHQSLSFYDVFCVTKLKASPKVSITSIVGSVAPKFVCLSVCLFTS